MAGHSTFNEDEVLFGENFEHREATDFHLLVAHLTGHPHTFHNFCRERRVTERTWGTLAVVLAVRLFHDTAETVPTNNALEAFTFGDATDVDFVTFCEDI